MKKQILKAISILNIIFITSILNVNAQSSVYFDKYNGAIGYIYNSSNPDQVAYDACIRYGGQFPTCVLTTYNDGYGAIAIGYNSQGKRVIGASAGYSNLADARRRAIQECINAGGYNISIFTTWFDPYE